MTNSETKEKKRNRAVQISQMTRGDLENAYMGLFTLSLQKTNLIEWLEGNKPKPKKIEG